ncbi:hypothetical protein GCM10023321_44520 [Pseudonocardia eucalypti]|uniref:Uncharacterized protein n=1 Tax=Pseudonocardia eucalypti TaxID=648755 RepID=A0ABP9QFD6_9PSEU|nr:hypothetical protein [Pseudonocardia eucalypti]
MSQLRAPRIAGVAGGVGTTTLATALRGYDRGRAFGHGCELLVCRCTGESLHRAAMVTSWFAQHDLPRPVLAVNADVPVPMRGPLRARLRMIEPQVSGLVLVPYVMHWRELTDPLGEAARLSETPTEELPRPLRPYSDALVRLAQAVLGAGLLRGGPGAHGPASTTQTLPGITGPLTQTGPQPPVPACAATGGAP